MKHMRADINTVVITETWCDETHEWYIQLEGFELFKRKGIIK